MTDIQKMIRDLKDAFKTRIVMASVMDLPTNAYLEMIVEVNALQMRYMKQLDLETELLG